MRIIQARRYHLGIHCWSAGGGGGLVLDGRQPQYEISAENIELMKDRLKLVQV